MTTVTETRRPVGVDPDAKVDSDGVLTVCILWRQMVSPELGPAVDARRALAAIVIASALLAEALAIADIRGIARTVAVLWFVGVCPGLSVVLLLSLDDRLMELLLSIALSVAIVLLVTTLMVFLGAWLPLWGLTVVVVLSVMLGAVTMARVGIHHEPGDAS